MIGGMPATTASEVPEMAKRPSPARVGDFHDPVDELMATRAQHKRCRNGEQQDEPDVLVVLYPEERPAVKQHVAQRATAKGADEGDGEDANDVHLLARRLDQAGEREGKSRCDFDGDQDGFKFHG